MWATAFFCNGICFFPPGFLQRSFFLQQQLPAQAPDELPGSTQCCLPWCLPLFPVSLQGSPAASILQVGYMLLTTKLLLQYFNFFFSYKPIFHSLSRKAAATIGCWWQVWWQAGQLCPQGQSRRCQVSLALLMVDMETLP